MGYPKRKALVGCHSERRRRQCCDRACQGTEGLRDRTELKCQKITAGKRHLLLVGACWGLARELTMLRCPSVQDSSHFGLLICTPSWSAPGLSAAVPAVTIQVSHPFIVARWAFVREGCHVDNQSIDVILVIGLLEKANEKMNSPVQP
jgi:hypothetical protein